MRNTAHKFNYTYFGWVSEKRGREARDPGLWAKFKYCFRVQMTALFGRVWETLRPTSARSLKNFAVGISMDALQIWEISWPENAIVVSKGSCHKRQKPQAPTPMRQSVTAKREKSQTPKVLTAILTLPNLT